MHPRFERENPAPGVLETGVNSRIVFLTITTEHRERWLACDEAHRHLRAAWHSARAWLIGAYLLMPDHLHCFCSRADDHFEIEQWITFWKRQFRRLHGRTEWKFQSRGWHHRLRADESYAEKDDYMYENPVRASLVTKADDWPFRGTLNELRF